ncbi:MAG: hypothetical protein EGQ16_04195 [Clostridiales bacterium]|nr:hypothetical protein [Clostridiales bacterium]
MYMGQAHFISCFIIDMMKLYDWREMLKNPFSFGKKDLKKTESEKPKPQNNGVNFFMFAREFNVDDVNVIKYSTNAKKVKHSCTTMTTKEDGVIGILVQGTIVDDKMMFLPQESQVIEQCHVSKTLNVEKNGCELIVKINFGEDNPSVNGEFDVIIEVPENMEVITMFRP